MIKHLEFDPFFDREEFEKYSLEIDYVVDLLWAAGYMISAEDAFRAWLAGNDGVWDNPMNLTDDVIVTEIINQCVVTKITQDISALDAALANPHFDDWIEAEVASYTPKRNAKHEGFEYDSN